MATNSTAQFGRLAHLWRRLVCSDSNRAQAQRTRPLLAETTAAAGPQQCRRACGGESVFDIPPVGVL